MTALIAIAALQVGSPLEPTLQALDKLEQATYQYVRTLDYPVEKYHHVLKATVAFKKTNSKDPLRATFAVKSDYGQTTFDGKLLQFKSASNPANDSVILNPKARDFQSLPFLKMPLVNLAESLRAAMKVPGFKLEPQSTPNAESATFRITLPNQELSPCPPLEPVDYTPVYDITVNQKTHLPTKIVQHLARNNDTITVEFSEIQAAKP